MQCSSYNCWFTNRELFICIISKRKKMPKHCINWWLLTLFLVEYIYMYAWSRWKAYSLWSCTLNFCNYIYLSTIFWEDLPATYYEFSVTIYIYLPFSWKTFLHPIMSYIPATFMYGIFSVSKSFSYLSVTYKQLSLWLFYFLRPLGTSTFSVSLQLITFQ